MSIDKMVDRAFDAVDPYVSLVMLGVTLVGIALVVVGIPVLLWSAYVESTADTFELNKDEWVCSADHRATTTRLLPVGKVLIPTTSTEDVCDRYDRRPS